MKRNTALLSDQVRNKLTAKCVSAIVTEAFINALPFDRSEIVSESQNLGKYAINVVSKMHPETILSRASEATIHDQKQHLYVQNLREAIESVVEIATKRIVNESLTSDLTSPEIVAQAKLNSDETEKLVNASKKTGTDAVAKLVKDSMIDVIKEEKNAYETSAKLKAEVKEVIKQEGEALTAELSDDEALEAYFNLVLDPTDARDHISVFSRMQDVCMEAVLHSTETYEGEIPYNTLEKITLESTFPYFDLSNRSLTEELENALIVTESMDGECDMDEKKKKVAKTAFICTVCIMTLLQTLKSMHLAKPEISDIKNFVEEPTSIKKLTNINLANIDDKVGSVVNDAKRVVAMGSYNTVELTQAKESLEKARTILEKMVVSESDMAAKEGIVSKINKALESFKEPKSEIKDTTGYFTNRLREENLVGLEHAVKLMAKKPGVSEIRVLVDSAEECATNMKLPISVKGLTAGGQCVGDYTVQINALPDFGKTVAEVVRESAMFCDFGSKPVKMYFTDNGRCVDIKE